MDTQISKRRLLMLLKLLKEKSDEEHPLTTAEIPAYFKTQSMATERRTVAADVALLCEAGYDVITVKGRQNKYFLGKRELELPEGRINPNYKADLRRGVAAEYIPRPA